MSRKGFSAQDKINQQQFEKLCTLHCTLEEISGFFGFDDGTIESWCRRTYKKKFSEVYRQKRGNGAVSLRRKQMEMALSGNVTLLIWLGKQYLNQSDKQDVGRESKSIQINITKDDLNL